MTQSGETGRYGQRKISGQYGVINKKSNFGAKLGTAFVLLLVFGGGGYGYVFYTDVPGQVRHLDAQDQLAVPAAYAQWKRNVDPPAVAALRKGLASGRPALKRACAKALATEKSPENTPFLGSAAIEDPDISVREAAARALGDNGDINCNRYMTVALDDPALEVRIAAVESAGKLKIENNIPKLITYLNHPNSLLKTAAQEALEAYLGGGRSFGGDPEEWMKWYEGEYE